MHPSMAPTISPKNLVFFVLVSLLLMSCVSSLEFDVGGLEGWSINATTVESYNHWATKNRFHVGDTLYFKYENDSVLVVDRPHYKKCNTTDPLLKFTDGNTKFEFDRSGFFYFISGDRAHCRKGQRLIVRVMVQKDDDDDDDDDDDTASPSPRSSSASAPSAHHKSSAHALKETSLPFTSVGMFGSLLAINLVFSLA